MVNRWPVRWAYPMTQLRGELDRALTDVFGNYFGPQLRTSRAGLRSGAYPAVNVWEDEQKLYAEAEVPGLRLDDLEILVKGSELTLKGERKLEEQEGVTYHRRERGTGSFCSVVRLPVDVDVEGVEAHLENGVLTVQLPKAASALPRRIKVKGLNNH